VNGNYWDRWVVNGVLLVALVLAGVYSFNQASKAEVALCALRADLEVRAESSQEYLADLDAGRREPIPGITRRDITDGIQNQRRTIRALGSLECGS
jgi:hypothetical protein